MKPCVKHCENNIVCQGKYCPYGGHINKPDYDNCWHIYKYFINSSS